MKESELKGKFKTGAYIQAQISDLVFFQKGCSTITESDKKRLNDLLEQKWLRVEDVKSFLESKAVVDKQKLEELDEMLENRPRRTYDEHIYASDKVPDTYDFHLFLMRFEKKFQELKQK